MKPAFLAILFTVSVTATAHARLGESPDQLVARYGQPLSEDDQKAEGAKVAANVVVFQKGGFEIQVTVTDGYSVAESFKKINGDAFTLSEVRYLLSANSQGHGWEAPQKIQGQQVWARDDAAAARLNEEGTLFSITSKELMNAQATAKKLERQPSLEGF
jgi:hypothetical protein